jgi:hypothetical protein
LRLITTTRKLRNDFNGPPERSTASCFLLLHNCNIMVRVFMMSNLVVYRLILICTRFALGCHIGELELVHVVRVDANIATLPLPVAGANLLSGPQLSFVVGDCAMCLANQTSATHCLAGVLATLATPTNCAESAEFMVPRSGLGTVTPLRDPFVDDGVCSALLFPKLTSTVHGTAGLLGNATWAMLTRIGLVLHAIDGRAPCLILFVQLAWSLGVGPFVRFVSMSR